MTARKTRARRFGNEARKRARNAIEEGLRDLERRLPPNLRSAVSDLRATLATAQRQMERAVAEREVRWRRLENQVRRDVARLLRRLEKAVAPSGGSRARSSAGRARRKTTRKKKTAASAQ